VRKGGWDFERYLGLYLNDCIQAIFARRAREGVTELKGGKGRRGKLGAVLGFTIERRHPFRRNP